jgi:XRN 5'-3' exonuclease N-terminus
MGFGVNLFTKHFLQLLPQCQTFPERPPREPMRVAIVVDAMIYVYQVMAVIQKQSTQTSPMEMAREQYFLLAMKLFTASVLAHVAQCLAKHTTIKGPVDLSLGPDHLGVYLVFDGASPPAKLKTQEKRRQSRATSAINRPLLAMMTEFQVDINKYLGDELKMRFGRRYHLDRVIVNGSGVDGEGEWKCFRLAKCILSRQTTENSTVIILTRDTDTFVYGLSVPSEFHDRLYLLYLSPKRPGELYENPGDNNYFFSIESFIKVVAGIEPQIPWSNGYVADWNRISKRLIIALIGVCGDDYVDALIRSAPKYPLFVISYIWKWALTEKPMGELLISLSIERVLRKVSRSTGTHSFRMYDLIIWQFYIGQIHKFIENAWKGTNELPYQLNYPSDDALEGISRVTKELTCEQWLRNRYFFQTMLPISD